MSRSSSGSSSNSTPANATSEPYGISLTFCPARWEIVCGPRYGGEGARGKDEGGSRPRPATTCVRVKRHSDPSWRNQNNQPQEQHALPLTMADEQANKPLARQ